MKAENQPLSLAAKIMIGLGLGLAVGLFFGEWVSPLEVIGRALLQMAVLPYVMVSLIAGLGKLKLSDARLLASKGGMLVLLLWGVSLALVFLLPFSFPNWKSASFFSQKALEMAEPINLVDLYIPANPFHSMANNLVSAVVLFSICMGLALISIEGKKNFVDILDVATKALTKVTGYVSVDAPWSVRHHGGRRRYHDS